MLYETMSRRQAGMGRMVLCFRGSTLGRFIFETVLMVLNMVWMRFPGQCQLQLVIPVVSVFLTPEGALDRKHAATQTIPEVASTNTDPTTAPLCSEVPRLQQVEASPSASPKSAPLSF